MATSIRHTLSPVRHSSSRGSVSLLFVSVTTAAILFIPLFATQLENITVAAIAAVGSLLNTWILVRSRKTQQEHKQISEKIERDLVRFKNPITILRELSDKRDEQIDELRGINRALSNRAIELRQVLDELGKQQ